LFKALLYIGVDPQSGGGIAPTALNALIILGRIFGGLFMDLARSVLGLQLDLLNFAGRFGRNLYGLEDELENDVELESQTHANRPPSYNVSVEMFHLLLVRAIQLLTIFYQGPISITPNFR
jgi:hypothetical protein